jgi:hypothetical protein
VRAYLRNASPEAYLAVAAAISIAIALIVTRVPLLRFGSFLEMSVVLLASDLVIYMLMKIGLMKSPRDRDV